MLEHFNCRHEAKHNIGFCRSSFARSCWKSDIYAWAQVYFAIIKYTSMVLCSLPSGFSSDTKTFHIAVFPKLATWKQHLMRCSVSPIIRTFVLDNARLDFYLQTKANSVAELPRWSHMRFCECQPLTGNTEDQRSLRQTIAQFKTSCHLRNQLVTTITAIKQSFILVKFSQVRQWKHRK